MKQNNSAKKYLDKVSGSALYFKEGKFPNMPLYQEKDIEAAFNAGRESMLENMPELEWSTVFEDGLCVALSSFGASYRIEFAYNKFNLFCNSIYINCYVSLSATKQAANEHYKTQIKQALGL